MVALPAAGITASLYPGSAPQSGDERMVTHIFVPYEIASGPYKVELTNHENTSLYTIGFSVKLSDDCVKNFRREGIAVKGGSVLVSYWHLVIDESSKVYINEMLL